MFTQTSKSERQLMILRIPLPPIPRFFRSPAGAFIPISQFASNGLLYSRAALWIVLGVHLQCDPDSPDQVGTTGFRKLIKGPDNVLRCRNLRERNGKTQSDCQRLNNIFMFIQQGRQGRHVIQVQKPQNPADTMKDRFAPTGIIYREYVFLRLLIEFSPEQHRRKSVSV